MIEGRAVAAYLLLSRAEQLVTTDYQADTVDSMADRIEQLAGGQLTSADAQHATGNRAAAIRVYKSFASGLGDLPTGKAARERLYGKGGSKMTSDLSEDLAAKALARVVKQVEKYREAAEAAAPKVEQPKPVNDTGKKRKVKSSAVVERLRRLENPTAEPEADPAKPPLDYVGAMRQMPVEERMAVLEELEKITKEFGKVPTGVKAKGILLKLRADREMMTEVYRWQRAQAGHELFDLAEMYRNVKLYDKAEAAYRELIRKHPKHECAPEARKQLLEVRRTAG